MRTIERARTAASVLPHRAAILHRRRDRDRIDRALVGIDVAAVVVLGAGLVAAFFGR
ncbi:MAG: hypothetical protein ACXWZU_09850 [Actinomycetota bacterium]